MCGWVEPCICLGVSSVLQKSAEDSTTSLSYNDASNCNLRCCGCIKEERHTGPWDAVEGRALYMCSWARCVPFRNILWMRWNWLRNHLRGITSWLWSGKCCLLNLLNAVSSIQPKGAIFHASDVEFIKAWLAAFNVNCHEVFILSTYVSIYIYINSTCMILTSEGACLLTNLEEAFWKSAASAAHSKRNVHEKGEKSHCIPLIFHIE